jgi:hypothetical protein
MLGSEYFPVSEQLGFYEQMLPVPGLKNKLWKLKGVS